MKRTKIQNDQVFMLQDEIYSHSIIPSKKKDMWRKIDLYGDVFVKGAIFGDIMEINANNVIVRDAVFCRQGMKLDGIKNGKIWFNSVVSTDHSVIVGDKVKVRFSSDLNAGTDKYPGRINLQNTIVYGNVFCNDIIIKNSVVLGGVFARENIDIENSIIGTFNTISYYQSGHVGIIFPFAKTTEKPHLGGKLFNLLAMSLDDNTKDGVYEIINEDIFNLNNELQDHGDGYIISPSLRVFDLSAYADIVKMNLEKIAYLNSTKNIDMEKLNNKLDEFDDALFKVLDAEFGFNIELPYSDFLKLDDMLLTTIKNEITEDDLELRHISDNYIDGDDDTYIETDSNINTEDNSNEDAGNVELRELKEAAEILKIHRKDIK